MAKIYHEDDLVMLRQYCSQVGFPPADIEKILKIGIRDVNKLRQKINDYQELLKLNEPEVVKMAGRFISMLAQEVKGEKATSVQNKIQALQNILHLDEDSVCRLVKVSPWVVGLSIESIVGKIKKMCEVLTLDEATAVRMLISQPSLFNYSVDGAKESSMENKIKSLQKILQTDTATVISIISRSPTILAADFKGKSSTIKNKLALYQELLHVNQEAVSQMVVKVPGILSVENESLKEKIQCMSEFLPFDDLRKKILHRPAVLIMPKDGFKIRYMMAENLGCVQQFWSTGYMTSQGKVWARGAYITRKHPTAIKHSQVYLSEKLFQRQFGVKTQKLMQRYPLNLGAVEKIENDYQTKTGVALKFSQVELTSLGLTGTPEQTLA